MSNDQRPVGAPPAPAPVRGVPVIEQRRLRGVLGTFATGVTVVTVAAGTLHGMTANAFTSVSLDPPLVLVCVGRDTRMHRALAAAGEFAVSVLAAEQRHLAQYFAGRGRPAGAAQFASVGWSPGAHTGAPLLDGALGWLECTLWHEYDGGDHTIFVGRVSAVSRRDDGAPLVFHDGLFHRLGPKVRDDSAA